MRRIGIITLVGLGIILAGCSSNHKGASGTSTSAPTTITMATSTTTTVLEPTTITMATTTTTSTSPTSVIVTHPAGCAFSQLKVTASNDSAAGHIGVILRYQNTSTVTCTLQGYPGVAGLNAAGQQVAQAKRSPNGSMPGIPTGMSPPVVTLKTGQSASNFVEGSDVPQGGSGACPTYPKLLVTPPNTTQQVTINTYMAGCAFQVHPVVPGTSGAINV